MASLTKPMSADEKSWCNRIRNATDEIPTDFICTECEFKTTRDKSTTYRDGYPICCGITMRAIKAGS